MRYETVDRAVRNGYYRANADVERPTTKCEFARGVITLLDTIRESTKNPVKTFVLTWVASWIRAWAKEKGC